MTGEYNFLNVACALGLAIENGLEMESLRETISKFTGMKKRQELLADCSEKGIELIDDYAHHPTAVQATLAGMRKRYPKGQNRILAIFEPRSNSSRRKSFESDYPASFEDADLAILKVPPFRHNDLEADFMDSEKVCEMIKQLGVPAVRFETNQEILNYLKTELQDRDIMITMSNGHFDHIQEELIEQMSLTRV